MLKYLSPADKCPKKTLVMGEQASACDGEYEYIMIVDTEEQLCFMVSEAGKKRCNRQRLFKDSLGVRLH